MPPGFSASGLAECAQPRRGDCVQPMAEPMAVRIAIANCHSPGKLAQWGESNHVACGRRANCTSPAMWRPGAPAHRNVLQNFFSSVRRQPPEAGSMRLSPQERIQEDALALESSFDWLCVLPSDHRCHARQGCSAGSSSRAYAATSSAPSCSSPRSHFPTPEHRPRYSPWLLQLLPPLPSPARAPRAPGSCFRAPRLRAARQCGSTPPLMASSSPTGPVRLSWSGP